MNPRAAISLADNAGKQTLPIVAKLLLGAKGDLGNARAAAADGGMHPRIAEILKTIAVTTDADFGSVVGDAKIASDAFIASLAGQSILATMFADNALTRVPLAERLGHVITGSTGGIVGEGQSVAGSRLTMEGQTVPVIKGQSFIVTSDEVAHNRTVAALALIENELRKSVTSVVDTQFLTIALESVAAIQSHGPNLDDLRADASALLAAVNVAGAQLYWVASANVANRLALYDPTGRMTPQGGIYLGRPALVSAAVNDGTLTLIDARSFAGDLQGVEIATSKVAVLDLGAAPDSPPSASTILTNLWQLGLAAIRANSYFGVKRLRSTAAAQVTGIDAQDSPSA